VCVCVCVIGHCLAQDPELLASLVIGSSPVELWFDVQRKRRDEAELRELSGPLKRSSLCHFPDLRPVGFTVVKLQLKHDISEQ